MSIYAISDTHGLLPEIPSDATAIIHAGDVCPDFASPGGDLRAGRLDQALWLQDHFLPWVPEDIPFIMTWGNHDFVGEQPSLWLSQLRSVRPNLVVLIDGGYWLGDRHIWGTPWVPNLPYWAFHAPEKSLQLRAELIPEGLDVLISHGPPLGWGDYIPATEDYTKRGDHGGEHVGERALRAQINKVKPRLTVCGHIHEARGSWANGSVLNVSAVDAAYNPYPNPWTRLYELE